MARFQGLVKVAYTDLSQQQKPWFARALDARDEFENAHPRAAGVAKTMLAPLAPASALYSNKGLDWWERQRQNHPVATNLASFVPVAGAVPFFADAASDLRRGSYGGAVANTAFGALGLFGGGFLAKGLSLAGRAAKLGRGTAAASKLMQARTPAIIRRLGAGLGARVPGTYTRPFVNMASRLPGVRSMTPATAARLDAAAAAMERSWPMRHSLGLMGVGAGGMVYDAARGPGSQYQAAQQQSQQQSPVQGRGAYGNAAAAAAQSAYAQLGKTWHPYQARR